MDISTGAQLTYEQAQEFLKKQQETQGNLMLKPVLAARRGNR